MVVVDTWHAKQMGPGRRTQATLCRGPLIAQCPLCLLHLSGPAQPGRQQGQTNMDRYLGTDGRSAPDLTEGSVERVFRPVARQSAFCRHHTDSQGVSGTM